MKINVGTYFFVVVDLLALASEHPSLFFVPGQKIFVLYFLL